MRRRHKFLIIYFMALVAMSAIAVTPGGTLTVLLITAMGLPLFGIPGFLVAASPTILLYSFALLPLWFCATMPKVWRWLLGPALLIPAALAVAPGLISREDVRHFADRQSASDISKPATPKPKSIELIGDDLSGMFVYAQTFGDPNASCNDVCRRLLFGGEVDWVRMTQVSRVVSGPRLIAPRSATYRIERRDSCPQVYPAGTAIEKEVRDRLVAGDCLVVTSGETGAPEAGAKITTLYFNQQYPPQLPDQGPKNSIVESVKQLRIDHQQNGQVVAVFQRTETVANTPALPFYFGAEMHMQGGYNGATISRDKTVVNAIDLVQALREAFGYKLDPVAAPAAGDPLKVADRILSLPPAPGAFSAPQQQVINDVLTPLMRKPALNDADIDFIRRVIADERIDSGQIGVTLLDGFRKHAAELAPLVPVAITRMKVPVPERVGHYQGLLGWAIAEYPAEVLLPYRDEIRSILEQQPDWPTVGLLTRTAELGDGFTDLIAERIESRSSTVRQSAAVAVCRADATIWPALEPIARSQLDQPQTKRRLSDVEVPLMLALVRHGETKMVEDMIEKRDLFDKAQVKTRLATFEPGFAARRCRASL
jgi:hypothetical protein